jgi:hypothetical protein
LTTEKFKSDVAALRLNKDLKKLMMANNGKKKENPVWATKPPVFDRLFCRKSKSWWSKTLQTKYIHYVPYCRNSL